MKRTGKSCFGFFVQARAGKGRGQAAIFDGITFLLLAAFSVSMIYVFLADYWNSEKRNLANSHMSNFMLNSFKAMYFVEGSTLSEVIMPGETAATPKKTCEVLKDWYGLPVSELLKKDLRDGLLDNKYGASDFPGLTALRCASHSLFKEFMDGGYSYFVEVSKGENAIISPSGGNLNPSSDAAIEGCGDSLPVAPFTVQIPFRVFKCDAIVKTCSSDDYFLKACFWATQRV